jgi:hypothetical protein
MYLKCHRRFKDGREHHCYSVAEKRRVARGTVDRHILYLVEIDDSQRAAWIKQIGALDERGQTRPLALFPDDVKVPSHSARCGTQVRLSEFRFQRPRQRGACWAFVRLWQQLKLDEFWQPRLGVSREGTDWHRVLMVPVAYRLIDPGSEWRLHREWFERSAMGDLLGGDGALAAKDTLYRCLDKLLAHKDPLQVYLKQRRQDLFGASFDVLLYDLRSTYFESEPAFTDDDKRRCGYSRDHRPDCVQVVIALIVTPEGFRASFPTGVLRRLGAALGRQRGGDDRLMRVHAGAGAHRSNRGRCGGTAAWPRVSTRVIRAFGKPQLYNVNAFPC